jgi:hypothetical protein
MTYYTYRTPQYPIRMQDRMIHVLPPRGHARLVMPMSCLPLERQLFGRHDVVVLL